MSKQSRDFQKGYIIGSNLDKKPQMSGGGGFGPITWIVLVAFIVAIILSR